MSASIGEGGGGLCGSSSLFQSGPDVGLMWFVQVPLLADGGLSCRLVKHSVKSTTVTAVVRVHQIMKILK